MKDEDTCVACTAHEEGWTEGYEAGRDDLLQEMLAAAERRGFKRGWDAALDGEDDDTAVPGITTISPIGDN